MSRPIKVMVAKVGLDGHDRGAKVVARAFRDAGMEVVYTGLFRTPAEIVESALQEDVDVLGVSILSGAHMALVPQILERMRAEGLDDILFLVGGTIIKEEEIRALEEMGVAKVFGPETPLEDIVQFVQGRVRVSA